MGLRMSSNTLPKNNYFVPKNLVNEVLGLISRSVSEAQKPNIEYVPG